GRTIASAMPAPTRSEQSLAVTAAAVVAVLAIAGLALRSCSRASETTPAKAPAPHAIAARPDGAADAERVPDPTPPPPHLRRPPPRPPAPGRPSPHEPRAHRRARDGERKPGLAHHPRTLFSSPPETRYATGTPSEIPVDGEFSQQGGSVSLWLDPAWGAGNQ